MLLSHKNNNKIKNLNEKYLQLIYSHNKSSYENVSGKINSVSIHRKKKQVKHLKLKLAIEMFKVKQRQCPDITRDIFMEGTSNYGNLQNHPHFITPHVNTVYHGIESITYLGPKIWDIVPKEINQKCSIKSFTEFNKMWYQ